MTLEDLYADFLVKRLALVEPLSPLYLFTSESLSEKTALPHKRLLEFTVDDFLRDYRRKPGKRQIGSWVPLLENLDACYSAARLYVIARDKGMKAAILYKLSRS